MKIPLDVYIASNNPKGAKDIINKFNLKQPNLARGLRMVMLTKGEDGFREIAKVHPDKQLILDVHEQASNACGCSSSVNGNAHAIPIGIPNKEIIEAIKEIKTENKRNNELTKDDVAGEVKKALNETNFFVKDALPYLLFGIGIFLFTREVKTK